MAILLSFDHVSTVFLIFIIKYQLHKFFVKNICKTSFLLPDTIGSIRLNLHHLIARLVLFGLVHTWALSDGHTNATAVQRKAFQTVAAFNTFPLTIHIGS